MGFFSDSRGIQTHNLLIRSQVLYSVELGSQYVKPVRRGLFGCGDGLLYRSGKLLLLDACLLAGEVAEVEDARAADLTDLVDLNGLDEGGREGKNPLYADTVRNFAYGKRFGGAGTAFLDNYAAELLQTLFVLLLDFIGDGDGIAGLEIGELFQLLCAGILRYFHQIHYFFSLCNIVGGFSGDARGCSFRAAKIDIFFYYANKNLFFRHTFKEVA